MGLRSFYGDATRHDLPAAVRSDRSAYIDAARERIRCTEDALRDDLTPTPH
jgi:hypothetical protein